MKIVKKEIAVGIILFLLNTALYSQEKVERFCEFSVFFGHPKHLQITIDIGNKNSPSFKDSTIVTKLNTVTQFNSVTDILNFMSKLGWTVVSINTLPHPHWLKFFYFKKLFNESDVELNPH